VSQGNDPGLILSVFVGCCEVLIKPIEHSLSKSRVWVNGEQVQVKINKVHIANLKTAIMVLSLFQKRHFESHVEVGKVAEVFVVARGDHIRHGCCERLNCSHVFVTSSSNITDEAVSHVSGMEKGRNLGKIGLGNLCKSVDCGHTKFSVVHISKKDDICFLASLIVWSGDIELERTNFVGQKCVIASIACVFIRLREIQCGGEVKDVHTIDVESFSIVSFVAVRDICRDGLDTLRSFQRDISRRTRVFSSENDLHWARLGSLARQEAV